MFLNTVFFSLTIGKLWYSFDSADYLFQYSGINLYLSYFSLIIFAIVAFTNRKAHIKSVHALSYLILFLIWIDSGRIIAYKQDYEIKLKTGWYLYKNSNLILCDSNIDCELELLRNTKILIPEYYSILYSNSKNNINIFVGFMNREACINTFQANLNGAK